MKIHQSSASPLNGAIVGEISFSYVLFILQKFTGIKVFILSLAKSDKLEQGIDFYPSEVQTATSEMPSKPLQVCPSTQSLVLVTQQ